MKAGGNSFDYAYIDLKAMLDRKNKMKDIAATAPGAAPVEMQPAAAPQQMGQATSIINPSKQAKDILAANYLKEVVQTLSTSEKVAPQSKDALTEALNKTKQ